MTDPARYRFSLTIFPPSPPVDLQGASPNLSNTSSECPELSVAGRQLVTCTFPPRSPPTPPGWSSSYRRSCTACDHSCPSRAGPPPTGVIFPPSSGNQATGPTRNRDIVLLLRQFPSFSRAPLFLPSSYQLFLVAPSIVILQRILAHQLSSSGPLISPPASFRARASRTVPERNATHLTSRQPHRANPSALHPRLYTLALRDIYPRFPD